MSQANDETSQPPPEVIHKENSKGFHIPGGPGINHVIHNHVNTVSCNLVTPSSFCISPYKHSDSHIVDIDIEATLAEEYSENPNLSAVSSCVKNGPVCSSGYYDDSEEDRPGSFDYMPSQSGHVRIINTFNPTFDEEVKLDSSIGSTAIESPHNEAGPASSHIDCILADKQDTSISKETCLPHTKHKHPCWDYMPCGKHSDDEDMEDEEDERDHKGDPGKTSSSFKSSFPRVVKQVDERVSYNFTSLNGPATGYTCQDLMPNPYNSYHEQSASEGSKEDKKKIWSKDDSDKPDVSGQVDINGNPQGLDTTNHLQMHQWPKGRLSPSATPGIQSTYTSITIPPSVNSSGGDPNTFDRKKERRRMRLERLKGTPAEAYKGYRKFSDIDEILYFVEGSNTFKCENKSARKKQERSRKKDHQTNGPLTLGDSAEVEDASGQEESVVVTTRVKPTEKAMGNSFRRAVGEDIITKTWSEDDVDKNDFHDCLNTFPAEFVNSEITISNRDRHQPLTDTSGNNIKTVISSTLSHQSDSLSSWDSKTEKHSTDNRAVTKKSTKTKSKREKQDATIVIRPISPKSNMVKPEETVTAKDTVLVASVINSGSVILNNFTDKEPLPDVRREESFTEVKKRKKRPGGKELPPAIRNKFGSLSYHQHVNNIHSHNKQRVRTSTPPPLPVGSSIAASVTSSTSWPSSNPTHSPRDLSPSAFPVLSSQGAPLTFPTEARRNSCGDLNTDSIDSKIYDSDRESAKSLPAAHGARIAGELSPIFPVSYARMAAVLPKNDSINSPNSESGVASISRNSSVNSSIIQTVDTNTDLPPAYSNAIATPERKATVWKGSPRERRHSIGSSPEDVVEGEKASVAERNRQCGSQEVLSRNLVALVNVSSNDVAVSLSPVRLTHTFRNSSSSQPSTDLQQNLSPLVKCLSNQLKDSATAHGTKSQNAEQKTISQSTEYATLLTTSSQTGSANAAFKPDTVPQSRESSLPVTSTVVQDSEHSSRVDNSSAQTFKQSGNLSMANKSSKAAFNKNKLLAGTYSARKNSSMKSVIFLDKRFDSLSRADLGITFGFDCSYESKCEPTGQTSSQYLQQQLLPPASLAPSILLSQNSSRNTLAQTSVQHPAIFQDNPHIPSPAQVAASLPNGSSSNNTLSKPDNDNHSHIPKGTHSGPCNGLILPSNPSGSYCSPQDQVTICSNSVSASIDTKDLAAPQRTSLSGVKPVDAASLKVNSNKNSEALLFFANDPLVPIRLSSPAATDNPLSQVSVSKTGTVLGKPSDSVAERHCTGVTFTAASIQLQQCSQTVATEDRDNTDCFTSSLPSAPTNKEHCPTSTGCPESILRDSTSKPQSSTNLEEAKDSLEAALPTNIAVAPSPIAQTPPQQPPPTQSEIVNQATPVVYGLKIKPSVGCGKLLFVPSNTSKKNRRNSSEISNFLTKRWFEDVIKEMGSGTFVTLDEV